jgi:hypothetical protein
MTNTTVEAYAALMEQWQKTEATGNWRPDPADYVLGLASVSIEDGEFEWQKPSPGSVPAKVVVFRFYTEDGPNGKPTTFPGNFWTLPLCPITDLPEGTEPGTHQQARARIAFENLKNNVVRLLGYDPEDPIKALEGYAEHVKDAAAKSEMVQVRVRLRNQKNAPDRFSHEVILRVL